MGKKSTAYTDEDLYDDDLDDDDLDLEVEDEDEFDAMLRQVEEEFAEDEPEPVAREVPHCETTGTHELDGTSTCIHCSLRIEVEPEQAKRRGKRNPGEPREPMMSGHCAFPQSEAPVESHLRCAKNGAGNRAVKDKMFAPCPCHCHVEVDEYECSICGGVIRPAPYWTGTWIDPDDVEMVTFVHVVDGRAQEECP